MTTNVTSRYAGSDPVRSLTAIRDLLCHPELLDMHEWAEVGQHMTCGGAEAMARVLCLLGQEGEATALLDLHTLVDLGERRAHDGCLPGEVEPVEGVSLAGGVDDVAVRRLPDPDEGDRELDEQERALLAQRLDAVSIASGTCDRHRYVLAVGAAREAGATTAEVKDAYLMPWRTVYAGLPGPGFPWHG